ncbi:MAG: hypothetical protein J5803_01955 [Desulfovibrio sp.]|nr:hypothetical protein [Desulfovibrio sp.]
MIIKSEIELRHRDKTQKSISELLTLRRELRRSPFLNRRHEEERLLPSHQSGINAMFFGIDTFAKLLPKSRSSTWRR